MSDSVKFESGVFWYCVRTKPKKERVAAANAHALLGLDVLCPQIRFRRKTARGVVWFQEAMFPGYVFIRFDMAEMKQAVSHAPCMLNIPIFNNRYIPIPDQVIDNLKSQLDEESSVDAGLPLEVGEETRILDGSMRGLTVKIIRVMPAEGRVAVLLELLGTLVEAEFPSDALEHRCCHRIDSDQ